ncbi:hypothetical protein ScPMuIL_001315 [Solemya velum]
MTMDSIQLRSSLTSAGSQGETEESESKELSMLLERRKSEEKLKAQNNWTRLRSSIRNTIEAVTESDVKEVVVSHGIHHVRKINHNNKITQLLYMPDKKQYLTLDGKVIRLFMEDGRKKCSYNPEEPIDNIVYCSQTSQFVGWVDGEDEIFLMDPDFEIISQSRVPSKISQAKYNKSVNEFVTVGPGYLTCWVFRYGARHLIPRKMVKIKVMEEVEASHLVLEDTASRSQKCYIALNTDLLVYNMFEGRLVAHRKDLHKRQITAMTFFNPLKYLITGSLDGSIKIWDSKWFVKMIFVGHSKAVNALGIYPWGSAVISCSTDKTIRVWDLDTCDEVDRTALPEAVGSLMTVLNYDVFCTHTGKQVDLWRVQHLYHTHTAIGSKIVAIKNTNYPGLPSRAVLLCRDSSVRIVSPSTGDIITSCLSEQGHKMVDSVYAIAEETLFNLMDNGDIWKCYTDSNPCKIESVWKCQDPTESCNCLLIYEYVVDVVYHKEPWKPVSRGVATKSIKAADMSSQSQFNRTLLLAGRKDGFICVFNWDTGETDFKIEAHGNKGVINLIGNAKSNQLISAGNDNIIKVWRLYAFAEEALAPLMSFYCAHVPLHMTMIKTNLCVAFQDDSTATYNVVIYNLTDRNRFDHKPDDDHVDAITGLSSCPRLKLYASSSADGTIRIWNETNQLVRLLKLKSQPHSVSFCSARGDLLVGIGNHLHKISHESYMPKAYRFRMVSMKFLDSVSEMPMPYDDEVVKQLSKTDQSRLKMPQSAFKFESFMDVLTEEEAAEVNKEQKERDSKFEILKQRDDELCKIRDGELKSKRKPRKTKRTQQVAFRNYMKMFYDRPKPEMPSEDKIEEEVMNRQMADEKGEDEEPYEPEMDPVGFFPDASLAKPEKDKSDPLKASYPILPCGYIPNSIMVKLLWPPDKRAEAARAKRTQWRPPTLTIDQLTQIQKTKPPGEEDDEDESIHSDAARDEDISNRVMMLDTFDKDENLEEEEEVEPIEATDEQDAVPELGIEKELSGSQREKTDVSSTKSSLVSKYQPTPTPKAEPPVQTPPQAELSETSLKSAMKKKEPRLTKPVVKFLPPEAPKSPQPREPPPPSPKPVVKATPTPVAPPVAKISSPQRSPTPPHRPSTPLPSFITQFKGTHWFEKYFPNCNERTLPKPWTSDSFATSMSRFVKIADYPLKISIVDAMLMLHAQEHISDHTALTLSHTLISVLNQRDSPSCVVEDQKTFILTSLRALHKFKLRDKDFVSELLLQFLDGDKEVRLTVQDILTACGLHDPSHYLPQDLDSWDIWTVDESNRKAGLTKMAHDWLDRWMTSYKLNLQEAIERMQKGQSIQSRMTKSQLQSRSGKRSAHEDQGTSHDVEFVPRPPADGDRGTTKSLTVTYEKAPDLSIVEHATYMDALNYFCDMMAEKDLEGMKRGGTGKKQKITKDASVNQVKNTVLVLPRIKHKSALVRLGETHTSCCRASRETSLQVDYRYPYVTARGNQPLPGQLSGFTPSINLPMKSVYLNPFPSVIDQVDRRFQEPILITLKSAQKYFVPALSMVPVEPAMAIAN